MRKVPASISRLAGRAAAASAIVRATSAAIVAERENFGATLPRVFRMSTAFLPCSSSR